MKIRLYPSKEYIPIPCIDGQRNIICIDDFDLEVSGWRSHEYRYLSNNLEEMYYTISDLKKLFSVPTTDATHVNIKNNFRGFNILFNKQMCIATGTNLISIAVIKREDFNNGVDVTDENNWYYLFNKSAGLDRGLFMRYMKYIGVDKKKIIDVSVGKYSSYLIDNMFRGFTPEFLHHTSSYKKDKMDKFLLLEKERLSVE